MRTEFKSFLFDFSHSSAILSHLVYFSNTVLPSWVYCLCLSAARIVHAFFFCFCFLHRSSFHFIWCQHEVSQKNTHRQSPLVSVYLSLSHTGTNGIHRTCTFISLFIFPFMKKPQACGWLSQRGTDNEETILEEFQFLYFFFNLAIYSWREAIKPHYVTPCCHRFVRCANLSR